jgi:hypothetical protein
MEGSRVIYNEALGRERDASRIGRCQRRFKRIAAKRRMMGEAVRMIAAAKKPNSGRESEALTGKRFPELKLLAG